MLFRSLVNLIDNACKASETGRADNLIELTAEWKKSMNRIVTALREVDEETTEVLKTVIKALFEIAGASMKEEMAKNTQNVIAGTKELVKQSKTILSRRKA